MTASHLSRPDPQIAIAPPPPAHPFRSKRVLEILRTLDADPEQTDLALEIFDAVGGEGGERTFQGFIGAQGGRRLYHERPLLVEHMADRAGLAAMPAGSLGRTYLGFLEANDFAADSLVEINRGVEREELELDPVRTWFWDRFTAMHDLWHVVTGCDTQVDNEAMLLAFTYAQSRQRGFLVLLSLIVLKANVDLRFQWALLRAWRAGRRAQDLVSARWEELLPLPLSEVRARLGVERIGYAPLGTPSYDGLCKRAA